MSRFEVRIAGQGGQGIVTAGVMIGRAASVFGGKNVTLMQSYGPESRGGASKVEIIVSDEKIHYPNIRKPNVIAIMSQEAYRKNLKDLSGNAIVILDPEMIQEDPTNPAKNIYRVPATRIAEVLGRRMVANIVMLGYLSSVTGVAGYESLKKAILSSVPKGTEELNSKAFERGFQYGKETQGSEP